MKIVFLCTVCVIVGLGILALLTGMLSLDVEPAPQPGNVDLSRVSQATIVVEEYLRISANCDIEEIANLTRDRVDNYIDPQYPNDASVMIATPEGQRSLFEIKKPVYFRFLSVEIPRTFCDNGYSESRVLEIENNGNFARVDARVSNGFHAMEWAFLLVKEEAKWKIFEITLPELAKLPQGQ